MIPVLLFLFSFIHFTSPYGFSTTLKIPLPDLFGGAFSEGALFYQTNDPRGRFNFPFETTERARAQLISGEDPEVVMAIGAHELSSEEAAADIVAIPLLTLGMTFVYNLGPNYSLPSVGALQIEPDLQVNLQWSDLLSVFTGTATHWANLSSSQPANVSQALPDLPILALVPGGGAGSVLFDRFSQAMSRRFGAQWPHAAGSPASAWAFPAKAPLAGASDADLSAYCAAVTATPGALALVTSAAAIVGACAGFPVGFMRPNSPQGGVFALIGVGPTAASISDAALSAHARSFADPTADISDAEGYIAWPLSLTANAFVRVGNGSGSEDDDEARCYRLDVAAELIAFVGLGRTSSLASISFGQAAPDALARGGARLAGARCGGRALAAPLAFGTGEAGRYAFEAARAAFGDLRLQMEVARGTFFDGGRGSQLQVSAAPAPGPGSEFNASITRSVPLQIESVGFALAMPSLVAAGIPAERYPVLSVGVLDRALRAWLEPEPRAIAWDDPEIRALNAGDPEVLALLPNSSSCRCGNNNGTTNFGLLSLLYESGPTDWKRTLIQALLAREGPGGFWSSQQDGCTGEPLSADARCFPFFLELFNPTPYASPERRLPTFPLGALQVALMDFFPNSVALGWTSVLAASVRGDLSPAPPLARLRAGDDATVARGDSAADLRRAFDEAQLALIEGGGGRQPHEYLSASGARLQLELDVAGAQVAGGGGTGYPLTALLWGAVPLAAPAETSAPLGVLGTFLSRLAAQPEELTRRLQLFGGALPPADAAAPLLRQALHALHAGGAVPFEGSRCLTALGAVCSGRGSCVVRRAGDTGGCACAAGFEGSLCQDEEAGDDDAAAAAAAAATAGGAVGGAAALLLLCGLALLALTCCCCAALLALVGLAAALVVLLLLALLLAVAASGGAAVWRARRQTKAALAAARYDLTAFEGYEGEDVDDGLQRAFRELAFEDLTFSEKIGEGAFGRVFAGRWRDTTVIAIKELNVRNDEKAKHEFVHEANIMARVGSHPNVVHFLGAVTTEDRFYLVSEFAQHGSLLDVMQRGEIPWDPATVIAFVRDAALGLAHLHAEGIVHRDIAARNFLVNQDLTVVVTDFGLSRTLLTCGDESEGKEGDAASSSSSSAAAVAAAAAAQHTKSNVGPVRWMAPESLRSSVYSKASDVYMFGCFALELCARDVPFPQLTLPEVLVAVAREGRRPPIPAAAPAVLSAIMKKCWLERPEERPTMGLIAGLLGDDYLSEEVVSRRLTMRSGGSSSGGGGGGSGDDIRPQVLNEYGSTTFVGDDKFEEEEGEEERDKSEEKKKKKKKKKK